MGNSPNRLIQFHRFAVADDRCAMKVGTDALILGAWAGRRWSPDAPLRVLEIGAGSGIVTLMLAQRFPQAVFTALEIDPAAAAQAAENAANSPFASRIQVVHADFLPWAAAASLSWDWVVSNPPYFRNKPKSVHPARNWARHDDTLPLERWLPAAAALLSEGGVVSAVWPTDRWPEWKAQSRQCHLHTFSQLTVHGSPQHEALRMVIELSKVPAPSAEEVLFIDQAPIDSTGGVAVRTDAYKALMSPFLMRI
jgi:tRNA1Val (adenine37-N6)-methyltransferase